MGMAVILALSVLQIVTATVTIETVSPAVGPVQGGSLVHVTGTGFVASGSEKSGCAFSDTSTFLGGSLSPASTVFSSTLLQCEVPNATFLISNSGGFVNITGGFRVDLTVVGTVHSNPLPFLYFDTSTMLITMVSPQEGFSSMSNNITVTGRGFVPSDAIVCRVGSSEGPCTFLSSTTLFCTLPSHPLPSVQRIDITVSGDALGLLPIAGNSTTFTFYSTAPQLSLAHFTPSYAQLIVVFDREVEIGGEGEPNAATSPQCETVFVSATLRLLGNHSTCEWLNLQQRAVLVSIHGTSTVTVGDSLQIRADVFRTRRVQYSRLSQQQSVRVGSPPGQPYFHPIAIVTGPSTAPACGEVELSGAYSRNAGPHPLEYMWRVNIINATNQSLATPEDIAVELNSSLLSLNFTISPILTLPATAFLPGYEYLFELTVRNFLNLVSDPAYMTVVPAESAPSVLLQVVGGKRQSVNPQDGVLVEVDILLETCNSSDISENEMSLMWELRDVTNENVTDVTHLVDVTTLLTPVLWIPSFSLLPGHTYEAIIVVTSGDGPGEGVAQETITLDTSYPSIVITFVGGNHHIVSVDDTLLLDITGSFSFEYYSLMGALTVEWECARVPPTSNCSNLLTGELLRLPADASFSVDGNHLGVGTFRFTVRITNTLAESVTMATVEYDIRPATSVRGIVRIVEVARGRPYAVSTDEVILNGLVQTPEEGVVFWESVYIQGLAYLPLSLASLASPVTYPVLTEDALFSTIASEGQRNLLASGDTWQPVSMVIKRKVLLPGQTYQFRLVYTVGMITVAMADVNVSVASVPSSGTLSVTLSPGDRDACLSVSLLASGWTDYPALLPLSYQFGYTLTTTTDAQELDDTSVNWFVPPLAGQSLNVPLMPPNMTSVQVVLRVYNTQGGSTQVMSSVVLPPPPDTTNCTSAVSVDKIARGLVRSKNYRQAIADLVGLVLSLTPSLGESDKQDDIAALVLRLVYDIHDHGLPRTQPFLVPVLQLLRKVARWNLSSDQTSSLFSLTASILGYFEDLPQSSSIPGVTAAVGAIAADIFAALLLPSDSTPMNRVLTSNLVEEFFASALPSLGHNLCLQQGFGEQAPVLAVAERRFLLKATLTTPPGSYLTSDAVSPEVVSVMWGENLQRMFHAGGAWEECYVHGNKAHLSRCGGVCLTSLQYPVDLHWQGQEYTAILRTTPVALLLVNNSDGSVQEVEGFSEDVTIVFPLVYGQESPRGSPTCHHWDPTALRWSDVGCSTTAMSGTTVCTCSQPNAEFAVLEICDNGFYGNNCSLVCPDGRWGSECAEQCACSGRGTCHASSGACNCTSGYTGALCESECPAPSWGYQCKQTCACENGGTCHHANGMCTCPPGWMGPLCTESCPDGFYGDGCQLQCTCRLPSQCMKDSGDCDCDVGYTGQSCTQTCPEGFYGVGCAETCVCNLAGTLSCNHVNGSCTCSATWSGATCTESLTDPPDPPIWAAGIGVVVLLLIAVVIIILVIALLYWKRKHKKKGLSRVQPSGEGSRENLQLLKVDPTPGTPGSNDAIDDELNFTRTSSLTVIIPKGAKIHDMFTSSSSTAAGAGSMADSSFREPEEINGKTRWQVVHVYRNASGGESPTEDGGGVIEQKVYPRGVYLHDSASLKDLRSAFINSNQLEEGEKMFVFLVSMEMEETYAVDDESVFTLKDFEPTMSTPHTFYITSVEVDDELMKDLCVCGRVSEYVCGRCESQGYCTEACQEEHWAGHHDTCKRIRRQRRQERKERRRLSSLATSPMAVGAADLCVCGAPAEFECSACGNCSYCSRKCQVAHWAVHKEECGKE